MKSSQPSGKMDAGLASLVTLARYHQVAADLPATLKYQHFPRDVITASCFIQLFGLIVSSIFTPGKSELAINNKLINRSPGMTVTAEAFKGR